MLPRKIGHWLRSTPWPVALVPWLPLTSRTFGPPRRRAGVVEYFSRHEGRLTEVYAASAVPPPQVTPLGEVDPTYSRGLATALPPAFVFSLPQARLLGSAGWVVGRRDTLLVEASFWREPDFPHPFSTHFILGRSAPGRCAGCAVAAFRWRRISRSADLATFSTTAFRGCIWRSRRATGSINLTGSICPVCFPPASRRWWPGWACPRKKS